MNDETTIPSADRMRSYDSGYMQAGKKAENIVMQWLREQPWTIGVDDLRPLRIMQEADVDCTIKTADGRITLAEIKSDKHLGISKNVLFEALRINHTCVADKAVTLGWSARSPAKWLLYYAPSVQKIYQMTMDDLRRACQKYTNEVRKRAFIDYVPTDNIKSTVNILIPKEYVESMDSFKIHDLARFQATIGLGL